MAAGCRPSRDGRPGCAGRLDTGRRRLAGGRGGQRGRGRRGRGRRAGHRGLGAGGATVENAALLVVPAVVGAWAAAGPAVVVGRLPVRGLVSTVGVEGVGAVVGARGPVVGVDVDLGAGSVGTVGSARAGARRGGDGWGSRVAEATRAARTPVVSPKATSMSRQGHRELVRCRGGGVDMGMSRFDFIFKAFTAHFLGALPGRIPLRRWPHSP